MNILINNLNLNAVIFFITAFFLSSFNIFSQEISSFKIKNNTYKYHFSINSHLADSNISFNNNDSKKFKMKKSPLTAVLLSAVLPGAGQFYNQSYWKVPVIGALIGYLGYEYFRNNNKYLDYKEQYKNSQNEINQNGDLNLKSLREFYKNQRNDFLWYFLIVYVLNLVDAYVDAHLFDFDVNQEKISSPIITQYKFSLKMNLMW